MNTKSTNNSTYSNSSNDIYTQSINQTKLDTYSATSSIVNVEIGSGIVSNNTKPHENKSTVEATASSNQQFQLTNDDFDFLEKMTSFDKEIIKEPSTKPKKLSEKKIKSSKSSTKIGEDSQSFNDDSSVSSSTKKSKKNKDSDENKEKKEKKKSKSSSKTAKKSSSRKRDDEDDDVENNHISIKKDEDYEEL